MRRNRTGFGLSIKSHAVAALLWHRLIRFREGGPSLLPRNVREGPAQPLGSDDEDDSLDHRCGVGPFARFANEEPGEDDELVRRYSSAKVPLSPHDRGMGQSEFQRLEDYFADMVLGDSKVLVQPMDTNDALIPWMEMENHLGYYGIGPDGRVEPPCPELDVLLAFLRRAKEGSYQRPQLPSGRLPAGLPGPWAPDFIDLQDYRRAMSRYYRMLVCAPLGYQPSVVPAQPVEVGLEGRPHALPRPLPKLVSYRSAQRREAASSEVEFEVTGVISSRETGSGDGSSDPGTATSATTT